MSLVFGVGMLVANLFLSWGLIQKNEKIILLPPEINKTMWISGSYASKEYLEEMSLFLSGLMLDQTPTSSAAKREMFLRYVAPDYYNSINERLVKQAEYLDQNDISTKFFLKEIRANEENREVIIVGELQSFVANDVVKKETAEYLLKFEYRNARYLLIEFRKITEADNEDKS